MAGPEQRRYKRLETNWITRIRTAPLTDTAIQRIEHIKNVSAGGVFIGTDVPFEVGTIVELSFAIPSHPEQIHARGIVKWSNNGKRYPGHPVGMGVEFLEVSTGNRDAITTFVQGAEAKDRITPLLESKLHQNLMRFYCRKVGESFPLEVLAQFLNARHGDLVECLRDLAKFKLVRFERETITFLPAENPELARDLQIWYEATSLDSASSEGPSPQ